jgi:hypothetical protein
VIKCHNIFIGQVPGYNEEDLETIRTIAGNFFFGLKSIPTTFVGLSKASQSCEELSLPLDPPP